MMLLFVESKTFTRRVAELLTDDDYRQLQWWLADNPESGDLIQGTGDARKLRWKLPGRGKSGSLRVIYFHQKVGMIWMLFLYKKVRQADLSADEKQILYKLTREIKND